MPTASRTCSKIRQRHVSQSSSSGAKSNEPWSTVSKEHRSWTRIRVWIAREYEKLGLVGTHIYALYSFWVFSLHEDSDQLHMYSSLHCNLGEDMRQEKMKARAILPKYEAKTGFQMRCLKCGLAQVIRLNEATFSQYQSLQHS